MIRLSLRQGGLTSNAARSMAAHMLTLGVSLLTIVILPSVASVETFGYWSLYILLTSFVYLLSFGLNDGILLRLGGGRFEEIDWPLLWRFLATLGVVTISMAILFYMVSARFSFLSPVMTLGVALSIPVLVLNSFFLYILLASHRIGQYTRSIVVGRVVFICLFLGLLALGPAIGSLIIIDLAAKATSLIYVVWSCRQIFGGRRIRVSGRVFRKELLQTASGGLTLMIAGLTAGATMGAVRLVVQAEWGIAVFAGLSLALSAANLLTSFLQAGAAVIFPWLRSIDSSQIRLLHGKMHRLMTIMSMVVLVCFFPMRWVISSAFPEYVESVEFLFVVFPVVIYQARVALLVTPFLNALSKVRTLLWVNVLAFAVSLLLALVFGLGMRHLLLTVMSMLFAQAVRMVVGDLIVKRSLDLAWREPLIVDFAVLVSFIVCATALSELWGALAFLGAAALAGFSVTVRGRRLGEVEAPQV